MSERMIFCLGDGRWESKGDGYQKNNMIFNKQVTEKEWDEIRYSLPTIKLPVLKWIGEKEMTDDEKKNARGWDIMGGYLKTMFYKDAWKIAWEEMSKSDKDKILGIKYFDKMIFEKITGIKIDDKKSELLKKADELIAKANELREEASKIW